MSLYAIDIGLNLIYRAKNYTKMSEYVTNSIIIISANTNLLRFIRKGFVEMKFNFNEACLLIESFSSSINHFRIYRLK